MKNGRPEILVTNDDGISAPGLRTLIGFMRNLGNVTVIAPEGPQSGMGHAITVHDLIRLEKVKEEEGYAEYRCSGTPVDCVKLAVNEILHRKPDLCVSGINHGSNSSINVIYSGTMSAAVEGAIEHIPSIGFSHCSYSKETNFKQYEKFVLEIVHMVIEQGLTPMTCLNVNIPDKSEEEIKGIRICRQANAAWKEEFVKREDPSGKVYYWLTGQFVNNDNGEDTDEWALANDYISVVPVQFDMTAHHAIPVLNEFQDVQ